MVRMSCSARCREMVRISSVGAGPSSSLTSGSDRASECSNQLANPWMPRCAMSRSEARSSVDSCLYQDSVDSRCAFTAFVSEPEWDFRTWSASSET